ncbi:hypothetical protein VNO78_00691 [Psophocarpus tetragonolobus]|uniref:Glutaredoxin domain-containing protein n=1 Tax=Psophocarpus tetragonolobus TaxID=3891 RepID=A0AAN9XUA2_PSOTE
MQGIGIGCCSNDVVAQLELSPSMSNSSSLSMELDESTESRIQRLISEHPVIIFTRSSCCMCHVMKKLLATIGVHPTVIELEDHEIAALPDTMAPAAFIGGTCIGGLESLVALHVSGHLIPKLVEVGALWGTRVQEWRRVKIIVSIWLWTLASTLYWGPIHNYYAFGTLDFVTFLGNPKLIYPPFCFYLYVKFINFQFKMMALCFNEDHNGKLVLIGWVGP